MYNNGKRYGQIVFLAGGAGSGKGFAIDKFMEGDKFKIRDVDELKLAFQKLSRLDKFTTQQLLDKYGQNLSVNDKDFKTENQNGIRTGFKEVDDKLGGCWFNSALIIIAGRPGMGKTTFALNIARNASVLYGHSGAIFSLEMSKNQLTILKHQ